MSKTFYTPYTYLIGWSEHKKYYYGVRYATKHKCLYSSGCHPDEFWKTYFSTSDYVEKFRNEFGEPDIIQIRKTFESKEEAINWEFKVLKRMNVINEDIWLNKNNSDSPPHMVGVNHPMYGTKLSEERKLQISKQHKGKTISEEQKKSIREAEKKKVFTEEYRKKISDSLKCVLKSDNHKENMRKAKAKEPKRMCPHCGKIGKGGNMTRYHFDNCKERGLNG